MLKFEPGATYPYHNHPGGEEIFTVLLGANVKPATLNNQKLNHYSFLKMIEDEFALGHLGREDAKAAVINGIWK